VWKACFHKWPIPKDDVEGLEGVVFRATICGIAVLLIHGVHPSPRAWIGAGAYQRYVYCMHVFRACLQNPANPAAAWKQIVLADKENVDQMRQFFLRKKVDLQDIKNVKNSCLHRVLSCVSSSWEAIEKTAQILCATKLKPLEIAILATQADDIEGVAVGITAFGTALAALQVSRTSMVPTGVMEGIVRLSNFLAFTHDGDQSSRTAIEAGVAAILSDLAPVPRDMLIHVISMIPATVLLEGSLCTVVNDLQNSGLAGFGKKDFLELLCVGGALTAIANGSLPTAIEAMRLAGFEKKDFLELLCVDGALTAMANGSLPTAIETLRKEGIPGNLCTMILRRNGMIAHLANGDFSIVTYRTNSLGLHQSGSDPMYSYTAFWMAIPFILSDHFFSGQRELDNVTTGEEKISTNRMRRAICCQKWRAAIRAGHFPEAREILSSKHDDEVVTQKVATRKVNSFEEQITSHLFSMCQDPTKWSAAGTVLDTFESSPMWSVWRDSGHDRAVLKNFIERLRTKHKRKALPATGGNAPADAPKPKKRKAAPAPEAAAPAHAADKKADAPKDAEAPADAPKPKKKKASPAPDAAAPAPAAEKKADAPADAPNPKKKKAAPAPDAAAPSPADAPKAAAPKLFGEAQFF
jgi:stage V sporulation protein SpoVS